MKSTVLTTTIVDALNPQRGNPPPEFIAFLVFWVVLGLSSFLFFYFSRNAALKRKVFPIFVILAGAIFGGFVYYTMGSQQQVLFVVVPAIILISFLNIRTTRFCDSCGKTLYRQPVFSRTQFCPHCGGQLQ